MLENLKTGEAHSAIVKVSIRFAADSALLSANADPIRVRRGE
jgi:hypothetical protein